MVEMKVAGIAIDSVSNTPIVILQDIKEGKRILPIWVGHFEAQAILFALEKILPPRPLTHDLLKNVIELLSAKLEKIVINSLCENVFYAKLCLNVNNNSIKEIDSRPSDAIALALRSNAAIFVTEPVLNSATMPPTPINDEEVERFKEKLKNLRPEDIKF